MVGSGDRWYGSGRLAAKLVVEPGLPILATIPLYGRSLSMIEKWHRKLGATCSQGFWFVTNTSLKELQVCYS